MKTAFARYGDVFNTKITNADYELNDIIELIDIINKEKHKNNMIIGTGIDIVKIDRILKNY